MSIVLRPHHLLCTQGYSGHGYSEAFVEHMNDVVHQLREVPGTKIQLTFSTDTLCSCCPNKLGTDLCDTQEKVKRYDRKTVEYFRAVRLRTRLFKNGECLYQPRALSAIRAHCLAQVDTLWEEVTRFENPHSYYVDLSQKLWDEKNRLLSENQY